MCEESVVLEARAEAQGSQFEIPETKPEIRDMEAPSLETIAQQLGISFKVIFT